MKHGVNVVLSNDNPDQYVQPSGSIRAARLQIRKVFPIATYSVSVSVCFFVRVCASVRVRVVRVRGSVSVCVCVCLRTCTLLYFIIQFSL